MPERQIPVDRERARLQIGKVRSTAMALTIKKRPTTPPPAVETRGQPVDRLVVDATTFERIADRIENPRPPTKAMLALFQK
jgi:hypothetical protein